MRCTTPVAAAGGVDVVGEAQARAGPSPTYSPARWPIPPQPLLVLALGDDGEHPRRHDRQLLHLEVRVRVAHADIGRDVEDLRQPVLDADRAEIVVRLGGLVVVAGPADVQQPDGDALGGRRARGASPRVTAWLC